jgi:NAD(P)-dependent dehydrogenase (short-subunit alcohol dehydrogenase family)
MSPDPLIRFMNNIHSKWMIENSSSVQIFPNRELNLERILTMTSPLAIIAGVGPGVGAAVGRRFANHLAAIAAPILASGGMAAPYCADLSDHDAVSGVIARIIADHGRPTVLVWNAAVWDETPAPELEPAAFDRQLRLGLTGALTAIRAAAPAMKAGGAGTVLLTGGGLALAPQYGGAVPALTAVKSALRGFVHASSPAFAAQGLRLGTVTIAGQVAPGTAFDPDRIAEAFWALHSEETPKVEQVFDGT